MYSSNLMYANKLEIKRGIEGYADQRHDFTIDETEEALFPNGKFMPGLVFSRKTSGTQVQIGVTNGKIPFFLWRESDSPMSFSGSVSPASAAAAMGGHTMGGNRVMRFFSGMGHFEVSTTQYKTDDSYVVDDPLYAPGFASPGVYDVLAGRVRKTTYNTAHTIVGIVSLPCTSVAPTKNVHGSNALHFTTCFIPYRLDP